MWCNAEGESEIEIIAIKVREKEKKRNLQKRPGKTSVHGVHEGRMKCIIIVAQVSVPFGSSLSAWIILQVAKEDTN